MQPIDYTMSHAEYLALDRLSASGIKQLLRSPAHYREAVDHPTPPTQAQQLGTMAHLAILERDSYEARVCVAPDLDRRTKVGKETFAAFQAERKPDDIIATQAQVDAVAAMRESVMANQYARALLDSGKPEVSIFWEEDGIEAKARIDWLCDAHDVIFDLKTAKDASFDGFAKACGSYQYHVQHAWYVCGGEKVGLGRRTFVFCVVESEPPYACALYQLDDEAVMAAEARVSRALNIYRECQSSNTWPGYEASIQQLSLPRWAL
jgi:hypothetical protein